MENSASSQLTVLPDILLSSSSNLPTRVYIHTGTSMVTGPTKVAAKNTEQTISRKSLHHIEEVKTDVKWDVKFPENCAKMNDNRTVSENNAKTGRRKGDSEQMDSLKLPELQNKPRSASLASSPNMWPQKSTPTMSPGHDKDIDDGKHLYTQALQKARKARHAEERKTFPHINIKYLDKRENTKDMMKNEEMLPIPFSQTERKVTVVRNAMYGNFLRKSTKKLQDDLRHTMRVYSSEKHELLRQLASLRHEMDELKSSDTSSSPISSLSDSSSLRFGPRFFHAPNVAAHKVGRKGKRHKNSISSDGSMGSQNQKLKEGILRLPTIKDVSITTQEWESGNSMYPNLPPIEPAKGLAAATAMLDNAFTIPKISDPNREDISVSDLGTRSIKEKKKVHFSEEDNITEFEVIRYGASNAGEDIHSQHYYRRPRASKKGRGERGGSRATLAPLKRPSNAKEAQKVAAEYKSLYLSIHDPEERTKTLADILYAVRMRMQENEQNLKFGETPRPAKTNNTLCDFLLSNSYEDPMLKVDHTKNGKQFLGAPNHTAARIGRRSHAIQLQNYLRKMSKSRRMIEHMEAEQYRLTHIVGHKHLMAASQASQA